MPSGVYERTPETCATMSKARKGVPHTSKAQLAADEAQRYTPHTPEHNASISVALIGIPKTLEHCAAISAGTEGIPHTSEAQLAGDEAKRGGDDICDHHYIYDESDLSKYTVQMTRSDHTSLHRLLQKLDYKVPHINVKEK